MHHPLTLSILFFLFCSKLPLAITLSFLYRFITYPFFSLYIFAAVPVLSSPTYKVVFLPDQISFSLIHFLTSTQPFVFFCPLSPFPYNYLSPYSFCSTFFFRLTRPSCFLIFYAVIFSHSALFPISSPFDFFTFSHSTVFLS